MRRTLREWRPGVVLVENAHHGPPLYHELLSEFNAELVNPVTPQMRGQSGRPGKVERATPLLTKLEQGEVFLPSANSTWLAELEQEWLAWTGLDEESADQIDAAAYAAAHTHLGMGRTIVIESLMSPGWSWNRGWN